MKISHLEIHPIKSLASLAVTEAEITPDGMQGDRQLVLRRANGKQITGREKAVLLTAKAEWQDDGGLYVTAPGQDDLKITPDAFQGALSKVNVWSDIATGPDMGDEAAAWFSRLIGAACRLVGTNDKSTRTGRLPEMSPGFVDAAPLLMTSAESLADLNARLDAPVTQQHFRPNLVVEGLAHPFDEDLWKVIRVGDITMDVLWSCARCVMTTIDPATGQKHQEQEPFATLKSYRKGDDLKAYFGVNVIARESGRVRLGDPVEVLETRDAMVSETAFAEAFGITT